MKDHTLIDERSLAFDRLTARKIAENPALIDRARATLDRWLVTGSDHVRPVLIQWRSVLDGPMDELLAILESNDERARCLRQSSPFAGVLSTAERAAILKEFQQRESAPT